MKIAVAQINPCLGDFSGNATKILTEVNRALELKAQLVVFPEASLTGYHPFDLLERPEFITKQMAAFKKLKKEIPKGITVLFGLLTQNKAKRGRPFFNSAALITKGKKDVFFHKQILPTGDVFDEARFIEPGDFKNNFFKLGDKKFFVCICEDIWAWPDSKGRSIYFDNPLAKVKGKCDMVLNLSASPFYPGKEKTRLYLTHKTAKQFKAPVLYCNLVGNQDEVIFDGQSFITSPSGKVVFTLQKFDEDLGLFDLNKILKEKIVKPKIESSAENIRKALVLGIRDFCAKTRFRKIHLGLSGGIDSALVLCLAADAIGPANVNAYYLPTLFSDKKNENCLKELCQNVGANLQTISIQDSFEKLADLVNKNLNIQSFGTAHENLQSRLRGVFLMAVSNTKNSLLLACGNKTELATGYSTLYGDLCGGLLPIGDLTKSDVQALAAIYNKDRNLIPEFILTRPPSAELRPDQKDEDSLPPYPELDKAVVNLVQESHAARNEIENWTLAALYKTEFKRWQAPPVLKVSKHSFGRGRRWPIAQKN